MAVVAAQQQMSAAGPIKDLREWLQRVEAIGELVRIREEVDWDTEMGAITYMVGSAEGGPALLFENVTGHDPRYRSLWNIVASSLNRIAITMGEQPGMPALDL